MLLVQHFLQPRGERDEPTGGDQAWQSSRRPPKLRPVCSEDPIRIHVHDPLEQRGIASDALARCPKTGSVELVRDEHVPKGPAGVETNVCIEV